MEVKLLKSVVKEEDEGEDEGEDEDGFLQWEEQLMKRTGSADGTFSPEEPDFVCFEGLF